MPMEGINKKHEQGGLFGDSQEDSSAVNNLTLKDYSDQEIINTRKKEEKRRLGEDKTERTPREERFFKLLDEAGLK